MFIVTAHLVKPVNPDDLPQMRGVDNLKNGSPLGIEPKGEEIQGKTGFSVTGQNGEQAPAATPAQPAKTVAPSVQPAADPKTKAATDTGAVSAATPTPRVNPTLPVARVMPADVSPQPLKQ